MKLTIIFNRDKIKQKRSFGEVMHMEMQKGLVENTIELKEKPVFAQNICGMKLFWIFVIASIFGTYYEQILNSITVYLQTNEFVWEFRRGVLYGPFSPIYGAGAVLMIWLLGRKKRKPWKTILYGGLLGGSFEYLISVLQEIFVGSTSWNYSGQFLNIHGRTTVPIMIAWGIMCFIFIDKIYPYLSYYIEKVPYQFGMTISKVVILLLCMDMFISWTALFRQYMRTLNHPPFTFVGEIYDRVYNDAVLEHHFPNMKIKGGK